MPSIEIVPSTRPTIITMELPDQEVRLAFDTSGESLRERVLLALLESLVFDAPDARLNSQPKCGGRRLRSAPFSFQQSSANVDNGAASDRASTGYSPRSMREVGSIGIHKSMDSHSSHTVDTRIRNTHNAGQS